MFVNASRQIRAQREQVFAFLLDLENHWHLADGAISVVSVEPGDGGRVCMRGPLGVHRTAVTTLDEVRAPEAIGGTAHVGTRTRARVTWTLGLDGGSATVVTLSAHVEQASPLDRLLLAGGGRAWLESRFERILATLAERFEDQ